MREVLRSAPVASSSGGKGHGVGDKPFDKTDKGNGTLGQVIDETVPARGSTVRQKLLSGFRSATLALHCPVRRRRPCAQSQAAAELARADQRCRANEHAQLLERAHAGSNSWSAAAGDSVRAREGPQTRDGRACSVGAPHVQARAPGLFRARHDDAAPPRAGRRRAGLELERG